ncbi:MAG: F0F1 ATP synthase subunit B [Alphaproteobacteria bacterium]|nr:F0F1 ATP synthase subunit B [Alphaproteobacteria bacterium]
MLEDAEFWVAIAFVIFVCGLVYVGVPKLITSTLDEKSAAIRNQLDEARRLREEAQAALAEAKRRQREAQREAEDMLKSAREEAAALAAQAEANLTASLQRREVQAHERIAQAEATAIKQLRDQAVDLAIAASAQVLGENQSGPAGDALINAAIQELPRRLQ